ncbi:MAG: helix-turn-helix transcriptional regulator [Geobacteraceae bacterium]|nr:helix-turn-helix transcriptional regulator [Geobacteraceae bacterium]
MLTSEIRKGLGLRIKELRKQNKWTQKALAAKLDMHFAQLNKYECGLNSPPLEKLVELAEVFNTTVDYLLTGNSSDERPLHNLRLLERFKELEAVNAGDQETVISLIDAMIMKSKVEGAVKPLTKAG